MLRSDGRSLDEPGISSEKMLNASQNSSNNCDVILAALQKQDERLDSEMAEIKRLIAFERGFRIEEGEEVQAQSIVYVGPEIKSLLDETERNLERRIKWTTLLHVVA